MVMATYKPTNAVPRIWWSGLKDESTKAKVYEHVNIPMHAPLFFGYSPSGTTVPQFVYPSTAAMHYGAEMFEERSKYGTVVTPFLNLMSKFNNPFLFVRLRPEDAAPEATLRVCMEYCKTDKLREYARDARNGTYVYDQNSQLIPLNTETSGYVIRWKTTVVPEGKFGLAEPQDIPNFYENDPQAACVSLPVFEFKARWFGEQGNNIGVRFHNPLRKEEKVDARTVEHQGTCFYGIEVLRRRDSRSSALTVKNQDGNNVTYFSLKEGAFDPHAGDASIDINDVFVDSYTADSNPNTPPIYGDIGELHFYREEFEEVLAKMFAEELASGNQQLLRASEDDIHLLNVLSGTDFGGRPWNRVQVVSALDGQSVPMTSNMVHWLRGGSDGTMGDDNYDKQVADQLVQITDQFSLFRDNGKYPFHQFYDVGFKEATKKLMANLLITRQDVNITVSTVDTISSGGKKVQPIENEKSLGRAYVESVRGMGESEKWGTPCYRAVVLPGMGKFINNPKFRRYVPMTYELCAWRCEYMSNPEGLTVGGGYDQPPYNHVRYLRDVTNVFNSAENREKNWDSGFTHFLHKTDRIVFCPAVRTVYSNDTSVLTSDIVMQITCDINAYCFYVWSSLTGNSKLTDDELCQASDAMITNYCRGRYDDRVIIRPNTHLTREDKANGYSWTCEIHMSANNMKTVNESYIVAHRTGEDE